MSEVLVYQQVSLGIFFLCLLYFFCTKLNVCGYLGYQDMQKPWIVEKLVSVEEFANS